MKKILNYVTVFIVLIVSCSSSGAAIVGDINGDNRIGLEEALHALKVASGSYPSVDPSCLLAGKGDWVADSVYVECDVVKSSQAYFICVTDHTSSSDFTADSANWQAINLEDYWSSNDDGIYYPDNVVIGTATPVGADTPVPTLEVKGYMKLAVTSSPPSVCDASHDGAIALTSDYRICVCKNETGWVQTSDGYSTCVWPYDRDGDNDGDGYTLEDGDCDDTSATTSPGGTEICGDGIDQDCSGEDLACTTVTSAGQTWMDHNLGASRVATSSTDYEAYGDLYQWGRGTDGHEKRYSSTTSTVSTTDTPDHGSFITVDSDQEELMDWRTPQNDDLWQGVSGINNPCPSGFRLPTATELDTERGSWDSDSSVGAFASPLKLVLAGFRDYYDASVYNEGNMAAYWSSTVDGSNAYTLYFDSSSTSAGSGSRAYGVSVRCIQD